MANDVTAPRAPAASAVVGDVGTTLLRLFYDATGRAMVDIRGGPVIAWIVDPARPNETPTPVGLAPMAPNPPNTGDIESPPWALAYGALLSHGGVAIVGTNDDSFIGTFEGFLTWLATNSGASRKLSAIVALPSLINIWSEWARANPDLVQ